MFAMLVDGLFHIPDKGNVVCGNIDFNIYNGKLNDVIYDGYGNTFRITDLKIINCLCY